MVSPVTPSLGSTILTIFSVFTFEWTWFHHWRFFPSRHSHPCYRCPRHRKSWKSCSNPSMWVTFAFMFVGHSLFLDPFVSSVGPGCKCIHFKETYGKEYGVFTSPNWPAAYEESLECLLYTFSASSDQLIEITFDEFDVQKTNLDCVYGDYVKLFLHLDTNGHVNEESTWNDILCGKIADIEQTHYSSGSTLVFQFHSDWRGTNSTGFRGTYRFLSKRLFETDGQLIANTKCDYKFDSLSKMAASTYRGAHESARGFNRSHSTANLFQPMVIPVTGTGSNRGSFYSPQYPSTYPKGIRCTFLFVGQNFERIKVVFEHIMLLKSDSSCLMSADLISVHDGQDISGPLIGQFCNTNTFVELISSGNSLFIEFLSRSHYPGQGFKGLFSFEEISLYGSNTHHPYLLSSSAGSYLLGTNCDITFSSDSSKNGTFTSPNYPDPYAPNMNCNFQFNGSGRERVQILFTDFDLSSPLDEIPSRDCDGMDKVMVFVVMNEKEGRIDNFCGTEIPAQLMSNGPNLKVQFKTTNALFTQRRGFKAIYRFITNFGIKSGIQNVKEGACTFLYNSTVSPNGSFTSPNWPGLYPRDTECHYFFNGVPDQKVHITFAYFDIEGVSPCTMETASDYVEFSNYKSVDRKLPRHCGLKKPKSVESDGNFFRVTFKSNDRFDGTGFEAQYQFRNPKDNFSVKKMRGLSASSSTSFLSMSPPLAAKEYVSLLVSVIFVILL